MNRKTNKIDLYVCLFMFILPTVLCIFYKLWFVLIAYLVIAGIIVLFLWACKLRKAYPDKLEKKKEEYRTKKVIADVYEVVYGVNKRMQPYTQILCKYEERDKKKICFKSQQMIGKVKVMVGDKCMVFYDPNNIKNCIVVPQVNLK